MTSRTGSAWRIWGFFEKVSWVELDTGRHGSTFGARRGQTNLRATGAARHGRGGWQSQNRKNVYLSPYVEEPLNSKVIKSFVPELRSRKCFSCFKIPISYVIYIWISYIHFNIHVWLWYTNCSWGTWNTNGLGSKLVWFLCLKV